MANLSPNTKGMVNYKKQESERKKEAVLMALKELISIGEQVSKAEICKRAGVSKTFLYSYQDELLNPIEKIIRDQGQKLNSMHKNIGIRDNSKDKIIESLKRRINMLEEENKRLRRENATLLGKIVMEMD